MFRPASLPWALASLVCVAACSKGPPGAAPEPIAGAAPSATVIVVPGLGAMRCTPIGSAPAMPSALPLDLPRTGGGEMQVVFAVDIETNGDVFVDRRKMDSDDALLAAARDAHAKNADVRAVIRADKDVAHGRVIRVLDLLKQAGLSKIAFGVTGVTAGDGGTESDAAAP
jgi:biopolymer transport protein ExbD